MNQKTIFSIVDLEATGPNNPEGNRIIQFSCTFVQNDKIFNKYTTKINPGISIPNRITNLTGIQNEQVKNAPTFNEVANKIYNMLSDTVFVAHNVNFDFPLLNDELKRAGHNSLNIKAIDTVTLSQIMLPTLPSFRLSDISNYLNIVHKNPHSADSDAFATAWLLILLLKRIKALPLLTLKQVIQIEPKLPQNTLDLLRDIYKLRKYNIYYNPKIYKLKNGIVVQRQFTFRNIKSNSSKLTYPKSKNEKDKLFNNNHYIDHKQNQIMNTIYHNFNDKSKNFNLLIENTDYISKSIDYLIPILYLAKLHHKKIILSSDNQNFFNSITKLIIPFINYYLPFHANEIRIMNNNHYIDLNRFLITLQVKEHSNQIQFLKAKILVWLTMTKKGILDELNISNNNSLYLQEININNNYNNFQIKDSFNKDIILIDHNYLYNHAKELNNNYHSPYLIIDNATHLGSTILNENKITLRMNDLNLNIKKIKKYLNINDSLKKHPVFNNMFKIINQIDSILKQFLHIFAKTFLKKKQLNIDFNHWGGQLNNNKLKSFFNFEDKYLKKVNNLLNLLMNINNKLAKYIGKWNNKGQYDFNVYYQYCLDLLQDVNKLTSLSQKIHLDKNNLLFQVILNQPKDINNCILQGNIINYQSLLSEGIYKYFSSIIFTDQSLFSSKRSQFIYKALNLKRKKTRMKVIPNLKKKQLIHINNNEDMIIDNTPQLVEDLYNKIINLYNNNQRYLILFNSRDIMKLVYNKLRLNLSSNVTLLGENINCSNNKLNKKIQNVNQAIALSSYDNWLTQAKLFDQLIIAELPINDLDNNYLEKKHYQRILKKGQDPFSNYQLPMIKLKLKKCLNYLMYYNNYLIILDSRLTKSNYYKNIFNICSSMVSIEKASMYQINRQLIQLNR